MPDPELHRLTLTGSHARVNGQGHAAHLRIIHCPVPGNLHLRVAPRWLGRPMVSIPIHCCSIWRAAGDCPAVLFESDGTPARRQRLAARAYHHSISDRPLLAFMARRAPLSFGMRRNRGDARRPALFTRLRCPPDFLEHPNPSNTRMWCVARQKGRPTRASCLAR